MCGDAARSRGRQAKDSNRNKERHRESSWFIVKVKLTRWNGGWTQKTKKKENRINNVPNFPLYCSTFQRPIISLLQHARKKILMQLAEKSDVLSEANRYRVMFRVWGSIVINSSVIFCGKHSWWKKLNSKLSTRSSFSSFVKRHKFMYF